MGAIQGKFPGIILGQERARKNGRSSGVWELQQCKMWWNGRHFHKFRVGNISLGCKFHWSYNDKREPLHSNEAAGGPYLSPASTIVQTKGIGSNSDHQDERIQQDSTAIYTKEERQNYLTDNIYITTDITLGLINTIQSTRTRRIHAGGQIL